MYELVKTGCKHVPPSEQPLQFQSGYFLNKPHMAKQNGSSYFLCNILVLTFSTTTHRMYISIPSMSSSSPLVAYTDYPTVQKSLKTYSMMSVKASKHFRIQKMLVVENLEYQPSKFSKVRSKASHTKMLHLARVAELTPRRKKLYNIIWTREIALCKLRKKCRAKKLKEVCQLDSNPLIQSLSSSLNVDTIRFLATIFRSSKHDPKGRRWSYKEKVCILKYSARYNAFLWSLFPLPSRRTLQSFLNTVQFRTGFNVHVFIILKDTLQTISDKDCACYLMFDKMSESICISIRRFTVLKVLRILGAMAGQAGLQIMLWC